jgi:hypothetical protein
MHSLELEPIARNGRAEARPLRSRCCYLRREPGSHRPRCIADSDFDTQSDLLLAILTFPPIPGRILFCSKLTLTGKSLAPAGAASARLDKRYELRLPKFAFAGMPAVVLMRINNRKYRKLAKEAVDLLVRQEHGGQDLDRARLLDLRKHAAMESDSR